MAKEEEGLSIGALAKATGLGIERIRMWERRYGSPKSIRRPSGHRRYPITEVERLRLAKKALELGHRAGDIARAALSDLQNITGAGGNTSDHRLDQWFDAVRRMDGDFLTQQFQTLWAQQGAMTFLTDSAIPFLKGLGERWAKGEVAISEEHFASDKLNSFLAAEWQKMGGRANAPTFVVGTLPGDSHRLGAQMCAVVIGLNGGKVHVLGSSTPIEEILKSAARSNARAICLSISSSMDRKLAKSHLRSLSDQLPRSIAIVVGGEGADCINEMKAEPAGQRITAFSSFPQFQTWLKSFMSVPTARA